MINTTRSHETWELMALIGTGVTYIRRAGEIISELTSPVVSSHYVSGFLLCMGVCYKQPPFLHSCHSAKKA